MGALVKKKRRVRTKSGKTYMRTMYVRSTDVAKKHGAKLLAGAALTAGVLAAGRHSRTVRQGAHRMVASSFAGTVAGNVAEHYGEQFGKAAGRRLAAAVGKHLSRRTREAVNSFAEVVGGIVGTAAATHIAKGALSSAAKATRRRK